MITNRLKISNEATDKAKQLKTRLKAGPLYSIARMGLCLSLEEKKPPQLEFYKEDGMEFNRITLFGEYDSLYTSLLKLKGLYKKPINGPSVPCDELSPKEATSLLIAHINRGILMLHNRLKNQDDLHELIQELSL